MIIFADNGRLSTSLATNRNNFYNSSKSKTNNEKTIKVRGFALKNNVPYLPSGYFAIGEYVITCCATDAGYGGFYAKYDLDKIDENIWYEIEGVLEKVTDAANDTALAIRVTN